MSSTAAPRTTRPGMSEGTPWRLAVGVGVGVSLLVGLFAAAFLWPITTASPQNIPVVVAGPEPAVSAIAKQLTARDADLFDLVTVADKDAAVEAIKAREAQGAIVIGTQTEILTTSAGSPQVAQLLTQIGNAMSSQAGADGQAPEVVVTDVVPAGTSGQAANLIMLPALIGGIAGAAASLLVVRVPIRRFATLGTVAVVGGLVGAAVIGPWFDVLQADYLLISAALALGILAVSGFVAGLGTLLGRAGLVLGALLIMLVGNPWGGFFAPREFLTEPMGTIGAYMPNGTLVDLLRSINFFPDAATDTHWLVLIVWAVAGLVMLAVGAALPSNRAPLTTSGGTQ